MVFTETDWTVALGMSVEEQRPLGLFTRLSSRRLRKPVSKQENDGGAQRVLFCRSHWRYRADQAGFTACSDNSEGSYRSRGRETGEPSSAGQRQTRFYHRQSPYGTWRRSFSRYRRLSVGAEAWRAHDTYPPQRFAGELLHPRSRRVDHRRQGHQVRSLHAYQLAQKVFGDDLWRYGLDANPRTLDAFLQYSRK
jgi:hypothetical protein